MVVLTEYSFAVDEWRHQAGRGPETVAVDIACAGRRRSWQGVVPGDGVRVRLHDDDPAGVRRINLRADARHPRSWLRMGDLELVFDDV